MSYQVVLVWQVQVVEVVLLLWMQETKSIKERS